MVRVSAQRAGGSRGRAAGETGRSEAWCETECVWGGSAPRSAFDEVGVKAGGLDVGLGGRDPQRAGPHPDVLKFHAEPLTLLPGGGGFGGPEPRATAG